MIRMLMACAALCVVLSGCGSPFLHPVATKETRVADPGIVGAWRSIDEDSEMVAIIEPGREPSPAAPYALTLTVRADQKETTWKMDLSLTDIGTARYADLFLAEEELDALGERYGLMVLPVHQVMKIKRDGDLLTVWSLTSDRLWPGAGDDAGPMLPHEQVKVGEGEVTIITASTARAREVLAERGADDRRFSDPIEFRRVEPGQEPPP